MSKLWLTPVQWDGARALLGQERFALEPADDANDFLRRLREAHPKLLLTFKAALLPGDEDEAYCGAGALTLALDSGATLRLLAEDAADLDDSKDQDGPDGAPGYTEHPEVMQMSHCAVAYFHQLPSAPEALRWLRQVETPADQTQASWLGAMLAWLSDGFQVIALKE